MWNIFDFSLITTYLVENALELAQVYEGIIILRILLVFLTFFKICFFLRIYDGFSFLVQMMNGVFGDLKYFMGFFLLFIINFGIIFVILLSNTAAPEEYDGLGVFGFFLMAFRTSSGDFYVDSFKETNSTLLVVMSWALWIIAVFVLNIIFMNFIIAVISESYEKVMQKLVAESYRVKVQMIVERELLMSEE